MGKLDIPPADTLSPELLEAAAHAASLQAKNVHGYAKGLYQRDTLESGSMRDQFARDEWSQRQGGQAAEMQARRELRNSKDALEKARFQDDLAAKHERAGNQAAAEEARENAVGLRAVAEVATERARRAQSEAAKLHEDADSSGQQKVQLESQLTRYGKRSSDLEDSADRLDDRARYLREAADQRRVAVDADKAAATLRANGQSSAADAKGREAQAANQRANAAASRAAAVDVDNTVIDQAAQWGVPPDPSDAKAPAEGKLDENGIDQSKIEIEPNDPAPQMPADGKASSGEKPADEKPADGKPADGKPADGKPAEGQLDENGIDQSKIEIEPNDPAPQMPADGKAPTGEKPAEDKPTDEKPADGKPAEGQLDENGIDQSKIEILPNDPEPQTQKGADDAPRGEGTPQPGQLDENGIDQSQIELEPDAGAGAPAASGQDAGVDDVIGTGPITSPSQVDPTLRPGAQLDSPVGDGFDERFVDDGRFTSDAGATDMGPFDAEPATSSANDGGGFQEPADFGSFDDQSTGFDGGGEVAMAAVGDEGGDFAE